jgi:hypothetical protein
MHPMKKATLNYFDGLKYFTESHVEEVYELKQKRTGLEVELDFSFLGQSQLPTHLEVKKHKRLIFIDATDAEKIGFEPIEGLMKKLDDHCSLVILEDEYFEHTMKDIWMFLSNDPRDRDVFTESRFYSK